MTCVGAPPHLAIFLPSLRGGGAERVMVTLANHFAALGTQVDLVLASPTGPYLAEVTDAVNLVDLRAGRIVRSVLPFARYLRQRQPRCILSALSHTNIAAILAHRLARSDARLVVSERNSLAGAPVTSTDRIIRVLMRRLYPRADQIVAVSRGLAQQLQSMLDMPAERIVAIPNPVDFSAIDALSGVRPAHAWFEDKTVPVILAAGRLAPQKDYLTLIEAFARLHAQRTARLIILGEGPERARLERLIRERGLSDSVALPGFCENPFSLMGACDLFVLASRHEGFPNVLVQAMACGAPAVSTDCPTGPDEILEAGQWGRLVPVGDHAALAHAMREALDDLAPPDVRRRAEAFTLERVAKDYARVIQVKNAQ